MSTISISEARQHLASAVETAMTEAVFLERYGKRAAVIISVERYEELMDAFEELEDMAAYDAAKAEPGGNIPWEQLKAELGW